MMNSNKKLVWSVDSSGEEPFLSGLRIRLVKRKLLSLTSSHKGGAIVDVGCGRTATFLQSIKDSFRERIAVDLDLDTELLNSHGILSMPGDALSVLSSMDSSSVDMISFFSIMEHVWGQSEILSQCRRVLRNGGHVFINSPSWFGKFILENVVIKHFDRERMYSTQVDTHTTYFYPWQLWQLSRNAGFVSSEIRVWRSNFLCSVSALLTKKY